MIYIWAEKKKKFKEINPELGAYWSNKLKLNDDLDYRHVLVNGWIYEPQKQWRIRLMESLPHNSFSFSLKRNEFTRLRSWEKFFIHMTMSIDVKFHNIDLILLLNHPQLGHQANHTDYSVGKINRALINFVTLL